MPQARDSNGKVIPGTFEHVGAGQVVAYTGTAGVIANPVYGTTRATAVLTSDNTAPSDGDTVTIGNKVYTFRTALTPTEGEVLINVTADAALLNLIRAINHSGTPNTDYKCAAANTQVVADIAVTSHTITVRAIAVGTAGNNIGTSETSAHLSWAATFMASGADTPSGPKEVRIMCTTAAYVKWGAIGPVATSADFPVAAGIPEIVRCQAGDQFSAVQAAAGGNLTVTEVY